MGSWPEFERLFNARLEMQQTNSRLVRIETAATSFNRALAAMDATWEPHDWSDFS